MLYILLGDLSYIFTFIPPLICKVLLCFQFIILKEYTAPMLLLHSTDQQ